MNTTKTNVRILAEICRARGIGKVVFAPGSRSAPLVIAFSNTPGIECLVIPDERVAAYFALGMAQQLGQTVAIVCTSGTAVLNFAPAVCEAYYQQIPLLVITADRPPELIGLGENQAINQTNIYANYIKSAYSITEATGAPAVADMVHTAITQTTAPQPGPVHINMHLTEPLYQFTATETLIPAPISRPVSNAGTERFPVQAYLQAENRMVLCGMGQPDTQLNSLLHALNQNLDTVVITESTSNIHTAGAVYNADACLQLATPEQLQAMQPGVLVTIGKQVVSKRIKQYLKKYPPQLHVQVAQQSESWNFLGLKNYVHIQSSALQALAAIPLPPSPAANTYSAGWQALADKAAKLTDTFLATAPYSDLKVFETLLRSLPAGCNVQYGNSTPVRYSGLFKHNHTITVNANRGTSGIDGCVSTAAGAAYANGRITVCIVGDISFLYDSNALWNNYLSTDLRIVVINNSGGNIFRLIEGPGQVPGFEKYFETRHSLDVKHLALMYGLPYYFCDRLNQLDEVLTSFYQPANGKHCILEIKTDGPVSADTYKAYFDFLRTHNS